MRRWVALFLLFLLPLQWCWAAQAGIAGGGCSCCAGSGAARMPAPAAANAAPAKAAAAAAETTAQAAPEQAVSDAHRGCAAADGDDDEGASSAHGCRAGCPACHGPAPAIVGTPLVFQVGGDHPAVATVVHRTADALPERLLRPPIALAA